MDEKLRAAFASVQAEPELKAAARAAVARQRARRRPFCRACRLALAAACTVFLVLGGGWLWLTPAARISIDVNPSLELAVNRFDRVVEVTGYNESGTALAQSLDVLFLPYRQAVDAVLQSDAVAGLLAGDGVVEIGVAGADEDRCARLLAGVQACTAGQGNAHCYRAGEEELDQAHALGLSCGRYRAYQELSALDPTVTPEQVNAMTMRQIRDRIAELSGERAQTPEQALPSGNGPGSGQGSGHHGGHHG